jgi:hypothetical protein
MYRIAFNPDTGDLIGVQIQDQDTLVYNDVVVDVYYKIATNNYVATGGDGYTSVFTTGTQINLNLIGSQIEDVLITQLLRQPIVNLPATDVIQACSNVTYEITQTTSGESIYPNVSCRIIPSSGTLIHNIHMRKYTRHIDDCIMIVICVFYRLY